jgi:general secretion pathway protein J
MKHRSCGFTLLEVLVAMSIFAIIGLAANQMLRTASAIHDQVEVRSDDYLALVKAITVLERDISQFIPRGIRDEFGDFQPALAINSGAFALELTRTGWRNPVGFPRSSLQRVAYSLADETLTRHFWLVLDRAEDSRLISQEILADVMDFQISIIDVDGNREVFFEQETGGNALPLGIELRISTTQFGDLLRVYDLPETIQPMEQIPAGNPNAEPLTEPTDAQSSSTVRPGVTR